MEDVRRSEKFETIKCDDEDWHFPKSRRFRHEVVLGIILKVLTDILRIRKHDEKWAKVMVTVNFDLFSIS